MPFTAAHPAIILPLLKLRRLKLSTTGLVIGSMAPDFEYFFRLETFSSISHSLPGLLYFNLPVSFLLALLFQVVVRNVVIEHLPPYFKARALAVVKVDWLHYLRKNWFFFLVSAAIGSVSHIVWDGFTHSTGFFVSAFPVLNKNIFLFGFPAPVCRIIQHASTVIGLALLFRHISQCPSVPLPVAASSHRPWLYFWFRIFLLGMAFLLLNIALRYQALRLTDLIVTLISGWLLVLLLESVYRRLRSSTV